MKINIAQDLETYRLTCLRTESIRLVTVIIFSGGTPTVPIIPAWGGATIIFISLESEWELTRCSICISTQCEQDCNTGRNTILKESVIVTYSITVMICVISSPNYIWAVTAWTLHHLRWEQSQIFTVT